MYLDGSLYSKEDLLFNAAQLLPHMPNEVSNLIGDVGRKKIWEMCLKSGNDPSIFK